jgi:hypothetical protein
MSELELKELRGMWSDLHSDPGMTIAFNGLKSFTAFALRVGYRAGLRLVHTDSSRKYSDR